MDNDREFCPICLAHSVNVTHIEDEEYEFLCRCGLKMKGTFEDWMIYSEELSPVEEW